MEYRINTLIEFNPNRLPYRSGEFIANYVKGKRYRLLDDLRVR